MKLIRDASSANGMMVSMAARRQTRASGLLGVKLIAIVLLVPTFSWIALALTPDCALEFATHMATYGEHYEPYGYHVPPQVEKPQAAHFLDAVTVDLLLNLPLIGLLPVDPLAHDRPPPLFYSTIHSLRAPPTLIPA
jgi:hypothetical protein